MNLQYVIDMRNGQQYHARSMKTALAITRHSLGGVRIYRGAEYQTDRPSADGNREYVQAVDFLDIKVGRCRFEKWAQRPMLSYRKAQEGCPDDHHTQPFRCRPGIRSGAPA